MTTPQRRQEILQEMNAITRMERGKLCTQSRGPGTPAFHKLQGWHQGRNHTRYVPAQEVAALQEALAGHERFQRLAQEFADLTIAMTHQETAECKKKLQEVQAERYRETEAFLRLFRQRLQQGQAVSAEWLENTLRAALLEDGRRLLENLLAQVPVPEAAPQPGQRRHRNRECEVFSLFGPVRLCRDYYHRAGNQGAFPLDRALGLIGDFTPGVARMLSRTAAQLPYEESSQQIQELAGIKIDPSQIQRLVQVLGIAVPKHLVQLPAPAAQAAPQFYVSVDGTGVPMLGAELEGRAGRGADGKAKTREVKLAALFTQTKIDEAGRPLRDPDSTTYLGNFACSDDFGPLVRQAALARGLAKAQQAIFLGDGAAWVWEIARTCFPQAAQILDYYHASEHVVGLAKAVYADPGTAGNWALRWQSLLYESQLDVLLAEARAATQAAPPALVQKELDYLEANRDRMDYLRYRQQGWFIGSGVVEAGCKRVIGQRLKQSGMFWTEAGAAAIISLRCALLSSGGWNYLWRQNLSQVP